MELKIIFLLIVVLCCELRLNDCRKASNSGVQKILRVHESNRSAGEHEVCGREISDADSRSNTAQSVKTVEETLRNLNLTKFLKIARDTGLITRINSSDGSFTIFVPCNEVFEHLESRQQPSLDTLSLNVIPSAISSLTKKSKLSTLKQGAAVTIQEYSGFWKPVTVNCARITELGRKTTNGYVYVTDRLIPEATQSLYQILTSDARYSIFVGLIDEDIRKLLQDPNKLHTVFAFTNEDFAKISKKTRERIRNKTACIDGLIYNHITPMQICTTAMVTAGNVTLLDLDGGQLSFGIEPRITGDRTVTVNGHLLVSKDIVATNGVLHVLDGPILYNKNKEVFDAMESFNVPKQLSKTWQQMQPVTRLVSSRNDTIFLIPTFNEEKFNASSDTRKKAFFMNQVAQPIGSNKIRTLLGYEFEPRVEKTGFWILSEKYDYYACSSIEEAVTTCSGVIQNVFWELPLVHNSIIDILRNRTDLSNFLAVVEASGMGTILAESSDLVTLMAPINTHLNRSILSRDQKTLKRFVQHHMFKERTCCHRFYKVSFPDRLKSVTMRSMDGAKQVFSMDEQQEFNLFVSGSKIEDCNLYAINGIVHTINSPIPL